MAEEPMVVGRAASAEFSFAAFDDQGVEAVALPLHQPLFGGRSPSPFAAAHG
jgi:hypothetical protein